MNAEILLEALRKTAREYGSAGYHEADFISTALERLADNFEELVKKADESEDAAHKQALNESSYYGQ